MRLIDADALIEKLKEFKYNSFDIDDAIRLVWNAPDADTSELETIAYDEGYSYGIVTKLSSDDINDCIKAIKHVCASNNICTQCPMNLNCNNQPARWQPIGGQYNAEQ